MPLLTELYRPSLLLLTDLYQLTMAAGYFHRGMADATATCEMFVRRLPARRRDEGPPSPRHPSAASRMKELPPE